MKIPTPILLAVFPVALWFGSPLDSDEALQSAQQRRRTMVETGFAGGYSDRLGGETTSRRLSPDVHLKPTAAIASLTSDIWIGGTPGKVAELADSLELGVTRDRILIQVAQAWAIKCPEAAVEWAGNRTDPDERELLMAAIIWERESHDAPDAPEDLVLDDLSMALRHLAQDHSRLPEVENQTQKWASINLPAARDWVDQHPLGEFRENLMARVAFVQCDTAPAEAARLVVEQIPAGPRQTEAVISVVHKWGLQDLAGALAWVNRFPGGPLKERAAQELAGIVDHQRLTACP